MVQSKVLVVDDDQFFRRFCADTLKKDGLEVITASGEEDVLRVCADESPALVLVDVYMPNKSGIELLEDIKSLFPSIDVIVTTGYASVETAVQALKKGASDYLRKPFSQEELSAAAGSVLEQRRLLQDNEDLRNQLRLYELSRSFAAVEEPLRVATLGLDALREITGASAGFAALTAEDTGEFFPCALRNFNLGDEKLITEIIEPLAKIAAGMSFAGTVSSEELGENFLPFAERGFERAILVPLKLEEGHKGFFLFLKDATGQDLSGWTQKGVDFLSGQIAIAYKAALRFQEARGMAYVDSLTDLYNARYLPIILEKRISEATECGKPLSILFIDLDNFREVNTLYGHLAGSKTLIEVAWILEAGVRGGDTVIRYGGDEFTVVLPNADTDSAREIAERIRKSVMNHIFLGRENKAVRISACIGVATYPTHARTSEVLINLADQAMYRGKSTTRNVVNIAAVS